MSSSFLVLPCKCLHQDHGCRWSRWQSGRSVGARWDLPKKMLETYSAAALLPVLALDILAGRGSGVQVGFPPFSGITTLGTRKPCTMDISQPGIPTLSCVVNEGCLPQNWGMQGRESLLEELSCWPQQTSSGQLSGLPTKAPKLGSRGHQLLLSSSCAGKSLSWTLMENEKIQAQPWPSLERQWAPLWPHSPTPGPSSPVLWREGSKGSNCSHMVNGPIRCV